MKVWLDWDSGPYETVSDRAPSVGHAVQAEMTEVEYRECLAALDRYDLWQNRLRRMRERWAKAAS